MSADRTIRPYLDQLNELIRNQMLAELELIEAVCEAAIQGGKHGVRVDRGESGKLLRAFVDPEVPYGHIHEHLMQHTVPGHNLPASVFGGQ